jgi:metallo-beta-lactamase class B
MRKKGICLVAAFAICAAIMAGLRLQAQQSGSGQDFPPAVQARINVARLLAGNDLPKTLIPNLLTILPTKTRSERNTNKEIGPPTRAFDQLYFFGLGSVCSWALVTSGGIIQIDTLDNSDEARNIIEAGYRKMGLDPAQIKYILISHGHGDHYGGAKYLVDKYHPHVLMGKADWDMLAKMPPSSNPNFSAPPDRDVDVTDGQKLTLGNTTLTLYITPGHTPGTISTFIPVTDHGKPYLLAFWGGTAMPQNVEPSATNGGLRLYQQSLERFINLEEEAKVDGFISNHPELDGSLEKAKLAQNRKPGDPNPWLSNLSTSIRQSMVVYEFMEAMKASVGDTQ